MPSFYREHRRFVFFSQRIKRKIDSLEIHIHNKDRFQFALAAMIGNSAHGLAPNRAGISIIGGGVSS